MSDLKRPMEISIPPAEIKFSFARSSGPGGQNVNKVNSKAILSWNVENTDAISSAHRLRFLKLFGAKVNQDGFVILSSEESRDQKRNIDICKEKLYDMLQKSYREGKKRRPTKPTKASKEKRFKEKRQRSEIKRNRKKIDA